METRLAAEHDRLELWALLQEYLAELAAIDGSEPEGDEYSYPYFDAYWAEPTRHPFLITVAGETAGFALVRKTESGGHIMAEFYVRPTARRKGVGLEAARAVVLSFPGDWEIAHHVSNRAAAEFWQQVVAAARSVERFEQGDWVRYGCRFR